MSTCTPRTGGDVDRYVADLERALRGPRRAKRSLLAEARDGLDDAAEAYRRAGLAPDDAQSRAIADFGDVDEVAPSYQTELSAAQSRRTGIAIIAVIGLQVIAWDHPWPMMPESPPAPPGSLSVVADSAVEWLGSACLLLAIGLVIGARFGVRRPGLGATLGRVTGLLGWVSGALLTGSAVFLNLLHPSVAELSPLSILVPVILFVGLPVAGLIRSSRRCLALATPG